MPSTALVWHRHDLRVHDHEALAYAADKHDRVVPVYCLDPRHVGEGMFEGMDKTGPFRARFLLESLLDLRGTYREMGADLVVRQGCPEEVIPALVRETEAEEVCLFEQIGTEEKEVEDALHDALKSTDAQPAYFWGMSLYHIDDLPFERADVPDVYTPFRKRVEKKSKVRPTVETPAALDPLPDGLDPGDIPTLADLGYDHDGLADERAVLPFHGGETRGLGRLQDYIWDGDHLKTYKKTRNGLLGANYSSKFSAWLNLGCLSPRRVYEEVKRYERERVKNKSTYWLVFELIWADFFTFVGWKAGERLFYRSGPMDVHVDWDTYPEGFARWCEGTTGIPFVDANMREMNLTGFMSNRGRQNVASMLAKSLNLDWRKGAAYFEAKLVDYEVTSNWGNWAYNSGVGNDPRDRYFNIVKQAQRYDGSGDYVRHWLPELRRVPDAYVHEPHTMPRDVQEEAGCILGADYPMPVVDLEKTYERLRSG